MNERYDFCKVGGRIFEREELNWQMAETFWGRSLHKVHIEGAAAAVAKSLQSCLTVWPHRRQPTGVTPIPGILQAITLEWVAISFSNAWKWKLKVKSLSCLWLLATTWTAAYQAPPAMGLYRQKYWSEWDAIAFSAYWSWFPLKVLRVPIEKHLCTL